MNWNRHERNNKTGNKLCQLELPFHFRNNRNEEENKAEARKKKKILLCKDIQKTEWRKIGVHKNIIKMVSNKYVHKWMRNEKIKLKYNLSRNETDRNNIEYGHANTSLTKQELRFLLLRLKKCRRLWTMKIWNR